MTFRTEKPRYVLSLFVGIVMLGASDAGASEAGNVHDAKATAIHAITEIFFKRNPSAVDQFVSPDYIQHQPGIPHGRDAFKSYVSSLIKGFPDYSGEIENIISDGDLVSIHIRWTGTHNGTFMGIPATGRKISRRTADVLRVTDGKLVEHWGVVDQLEMLQELGIIRTPE